MERYCALGLGDRDHLVAFDHETRVAHELGIGGRCEAGEKRRRSEKVSRPPLFIIGGERCHQPTAGNEPLVDALEKWAKELAGDVIEGVEGNHGLE